MEPNEVEEMYHVSVLRCPICTIGGINYARARTAVTSPWGFSPAVKSTPEVHAGPVTIIIHTHNTSLRHSPGTNATLDIAGATSFTCAPDNNPPQRGPSPGKRSLGRACFAPPVKPSQIRAIQHPAAISAQLFLQRAWRVTRRLDVTNRALITRTSAGEELCDGNCHPRPERAVPECPSRSEWPNCNCQSAAVSHD
jgi:hypothetical protein